jgi:hypothetical protein
MGWPQRPGLRRTHLAGAHHEAGARRRPARPCLVVGQRSLHARHASAGKTPALYVYAHAPQRLDVPADEAVKRIELGLEEFAPGFRELVLARAKRTPADIERENPAMWAATSLARCEIDQQFIVRPGPELFRAVHAPPRPLPRRTISAFQRWRPTASPARRLPRTGPRPCIDRARPPHDRRPRAPAGQDRSAPWVRRQSLTARGARDSAASSWARARRHQRSAAKLPPGGARGKATRRSLTAA